MRDDQDIHAIIDGDIGLTAILVKNNSHSQEKPKMIHFVLT